MISLGEAHEGLKIFLVAVYKSQEAEVWTMAPQCLWLRSIEPAVCQLLWHL